MGKMGFRDTGTDPYIYEEISAGGSAAFGLDNSDNDKLKLVTQAIAEANPSGSASFVLETAGYRSLPLQCAFFAYQSVTIPNYTGNDVQQTITYDTILFDINSNFDGTNFTAPVTGRYHFIANSSFDNLGAGNIGTSNATSFGGVGNGLTVSGNAATRNPANQGSQGTLADWVITLNAGDIVFNTVRVQSGTQTVGLLGHATIPYSFFSAWLEL